MAKFNGSVILLGVNGDTFVGLTSNNLDFTADEIETTDKFSSGRWKEFIQGEKGGTIAFEARYDDQEAAGEVNFTGLFAAFNSGDEIDVTFGGDQSGNTFIEAKAFLTALSWSAPQNDVSGITGTLRITGVPSINTVA